MSEVFTIEELNETLEIDLTRAMPELVRAKHPWDRAAEIVEECIPQYDGDLLDLLSNNYFLSEIDDITQLPEKPNVYDFIRIAVHEHLTRHAEAFLREFNLLTIDVCIGLDEDGNPEYDYFEILDRAEDSGDLECDREHIEKYFPLCAAAMAKAEEGHKAQGLPEDTAWEVSDCKHTWF